MAGKQISPATANQMSKDYIAYMTGLKVNMNQQTQSIAFDKEALKLWMDTTMGNADELRIFMGLYPPGHEHAGRTTVVLWGYKDGHPVTKPLSVGKDGGGDDENMDPFNEGGGLP